MFIKILRLQVIGDGRSVGNTIRLGLLAQGLLAGSKRLTPCDDILGILDTLDTLDILAPPRMC